MARPTATPARAQATAQAHIDTARIALDELAALLAAAEPNGARNGDVEAIARVLEAAGCYIRRANSKGLLVG